MRIVPVLDLMGGVVVHGRGGRREAYAPIRTPLGCADDAPDLAAGLVRAAGADTLYVADLDAIMGGALQRDLLARIGMRVPGVDIWVDGGFGAPGHAARLPDGMRPVFGTESLAPAAVELPSEAVLSLDFSAVGFLGGPSWLTACRSWPTRVICMTMAAVGSGAGPQIDTIRAVLDRAEGRDVYAAGGVRHADDLETLARQGCAGALVATALHDGRIGALY
ncbi:MULTISPECIES: HisA/HisF-related TIM barrel protein [Aureimonas]|uniref:HisA/HisF-related TIM barrel protein n=1 Tax=Aureimonas TaxID=414371 RepID=UPI001FED7961|nr:MULTISPECIES: HisA/HisF-related TIM barrel protein [Aureimonas]